MGVDRFSRLLREVEVLAMPDTGLDTTQRVGSVCEVPPGARVPGMVFEVFIDGRCAADGVEVMR